MIHVYGFTHEASKENALSYFVERIGQAMKFPEFKAEDVVCFHNIRDVSPTSHMYSTSFQLPEQVAFSSEQNQTSEQDQAAAQQQQQPQQVAIEEEKKEESDDEADEAGQSGKVTDPNPSKRSRTE